MIESVYASSFFKLLSEHLFLDLLIPELDQFLKGEEGHQIYQYLETADLVHKKNDEITLERSILLSCLLYPILQERVSLHMQRHQKPPNLGEISLLIQSVIRETMTDAFTHFPRKLSTFCAYILTTQYRLTPLIKKKHHSTKFLYDKSFPQALRFLRIRALIDETLSDVFYEWEQTYRQVKCRHGDDKPRYVSKKRKSKRQRGSRARPRS